MLLLPGGLWQVPLVEQAQALGLRVILADGTPSPPAAAKADRFRQLRLQDLNALVDYARQEQVDAVITDQTDFAVPIVAEVAARLGLRGLPAEVARRATNKFLMREAVARAGLRQPAYRLCRQVSDVLAAVEAIGLPLFFKPVDNQSSRGVGILRRRDEAEAALKVALQESSFGAALFEELVSGTECTVEGFILDGEPRTLAISDKKHYADLPGVAQSLTYPPAFPKATWQRIVQAHHAVARALEIPFGITHAEFIVDSHGEPWLIEIAARGGGSRISSHIVPGLTGCNPAETLLRILLGETPTIEPAPIGNRAAQLRFLRLPPGRLKGIRNLDELRQRPGVAEIYFGVQPGDVIPKVTDDRSRHGFVVTFGATRELAVTLADEIEQSLDFQMDA